MPNSASPTAAGDIDNVCGIIDGYTESGADALNLSVDRQRTESLQSSIGGKLYYTWESDRGVLMPGAGLSMSLKSRTYFHIGYDAQVGAGRYTAHGISAVARLEF